MGTGRRVFLSHTSELDALPSGYSYVAAAKDACNREGFSVEDMSNFTAGGRTGDMCRRKMADCDVYIGIIGLRYGSLVADEPRHSYTELEFEQAVHDGGPVLIFMSRDGAELEADDEPALATRQRDFRQLLLDDPRLTVGWFESVHQLRDGIGQALREMPASMPGRGIDDGTPQMADPLPPDFVARTVELDDICTKVRAAAGAPGSDGGTPPTVVVHGAGGFGKTTLVAAACQALRHDFPDGILWVTLGVEPTEQQHVGWCRDLAALFAGDVPTFSAPRAAGSHLGTVLGARRVLLVIDDVWRAKDLEPYLLGGRSVVRLVITRSGDVAPAGAPTVHVDRFSIAETEALLSWRLDAEGVDWGELVRRTGQWPVLVRLVNGALRDDIAHGGAVESAVAAVVDDLAARGPAVLDAADEESRERAVRATIEVGIERLARRADTVAVERFVDLAIFPEDVDVPLAVVRQWWAIDARVARQLAGTLSRLSLVQDYNAGAETLRLHDIVRDYLRAEAGHDALTERHAALLAAHRPPSGRWADLPASSAYMWRWVALHLDRAGLIDELLTTTTDVAFLAATIHHAGVSAVLDSAALIERHDGGQRRDWLRRWADLADQLPQPVDVAATLLARPEADALLSPVGRDGLAGAHLRYAPGWSCPELTTSALETVLGTHHRRVHDLSWSPDGRLVASAGGDGALRVWSVDVVQEPRELTRLEDWARAVAWSPDGRRIACGDGDGAVWLYPTDGDARRTELGRHGIWVRAVAWSPDGTRLASASDEGGICVWPTVDGATPRRLASDEEWVRAVAWSPDGTRLASVGDGGQVRVWTPAVDVPAATLGHHDAGASALAWSPDGRRVASGGDDGVLTVWGLDGFAVRPPSGSHADPVRAVSWSPDGTDVAAGGDDGAVWVWSPDGTAGPSELGRHEGGVLTVAWAPDGTHVASGGGDGALRLWRGRGDATRSAEERARRVRAVAWAPDGQWLACGGDDCTVWLWSAAGRVAVEIGRHASGVVTVAWAPDGRRVATGDVDGHVRVWSRDEPERSVELDRPLVRMPVIAWSPDGGQLACVGTDGVVCLAGVDGEHRAVRSIGGEWVRTVAWSPGGGRLVASGVDGALRLWDVSPAGRAEGLGVVGRHGDRVRSLAWSPDGRTVASAGEDGVVRSWPVGTEDGSSELLGQRAPVRSVAWSSTGRHLVTAGDDGAVRVWATDGDPGDDDPDPRCTLALAGSLSGVAWQPLGRQIAVAGSYGLYVLELVGATP